MTFDKVLQLLTAAAAVVTAAAPVIVKVLDRPRGGSGGRSAAAPVPASDPGGLIGFAGLFAVLAFGCASTAVGLAWAQGRPPTDRLMITLGILGCGLGIFAGFAGAQATLVARRANDVRNRDMVLAGYGAVLSASCACAAIFIVG